MDRDWGALDMGHRSGIAECDECIGQFLQQQQAEETQQPLPWLFCASNPTPGTRERRSESDKAQAFFVVFMPHPFIPSHKEDRQAVKELAGCVIWDGIPFETPVISAKAGTQSVDSAFPKVCPVDSRFRGNDYGSQRPCLTKDSSTGLP
jgi:hypothetical protein